MSQTFPPIDYLLVGHVTRDLLPGGGEALGGTAAYAALTAAALGRTVGLVTSAKGDFIPPTSGQLHWKVEPAESTTTFENRYQSGQRQQFLHAVARPLTLDLLPEAWQAAPLVHVGPVAGECDPAWLAAFAGRAFVGVTPQGWMRRVDAEGRVHGAAWEAAERWLPLASAVVLSLEDLGGDWTRARTLAGQTPLLVVTQGRGGSTLFTAAGEVNVPAPTVPEVDPTGAGDIFAAALFIALAGGALPEPAARFATCLAARSVTRAGLAGVPSSVESRTCAGWLDAALGAELREQ
jgi:sugar/nucleoside kinase (ribokinase family)